MAATLTAGTAVYDFGNGIMRLHVQVLYPGREKFTLWNGCMACAK